jgi:hypothetical protein
LYAYIISNCDEPAIIYHNTFICALILDETCETIMQLGRASVEKQEEAGLGKLGKENLVLLKYSCK